MQPIVTVDQMRTLEAEADSRGVTYDQMMQFAGAHVADAAREYLADDPTGANILILAGPGNNGGDGLVAGIDLAASGAHVKCYFLRPPDEDNPQVQATRAAGLFIVDFENDLQARVLRQLLGGVDLIIDAIFGTGIRLPLTGPAARLLRTVSARLKERPTLPTILAVDCPTGVDCDTGAVDPHTLRADATVTFGAFKRGQFYFPAADFTGDLRLVPIGWPADLPSLTSVTTHLPEIVDIASQLPERPINAHKGTFGKTLICAGSINYTGAVLLAGYGAYRSGVGLVTLATPAPLHTVLAGHIPEATWFPLPHDMGVIDQSAADLLRDHLSNYQAALLGPGWGTEKTTGECLRQLLVTLKAGPRANAMPPLVIDADGLRHLAAIPNWHTHLPPNAVLTPHPGEMSALTGLDREAIQADRIAIAQRFAAAWGHVLVLKGAHTVIAAPDGRAAILPFATAALATAGTGDVLAGIITGLLAQGCQPYAAAVAGAYIHGLSGELAAAEFDNTIAVVASDLLAALPAAFALVVEATNGSGSAILGVREP